MRGPQVECTTTHTINFALSSPYRLEMSELARLLANDTTRQLAFTIGTVEPTIAFAAGAVAGPALLGGMANTPDIQDATIEVHGFVIAAGSVRWRNSADRKGRREQCYGSKRRFHFHSG